jgi:hypothetical protein
MFYNNTSTAASKPSVEIITSTGTCPAEWRQWWLAKAKAAGSDWPSVLALHLSVSDSLRRSS